MEKTAALNGLLEPGEKVLWSDSPAPWPLTAPSFIIYIFAVPWTIFTFGWLWIMTDGLQWLPPATGIYPSWTPRFYAWSALAAFLPGVWMLTAPFWAWRKARRTVYAVTHRRVLQFDAARPAKAQILDLAGRVTIRVKAGENGPGDLEFLIDGEHRGMLLKAVPNPGTVRKSLENR